MVVAPPNTNTGSGIGSAIGGSIEPIRSNTGIDAPMDPSSGLPDFESLIANQPILFTVGGPAAPNIPVTFATTVTEPAVEPAMEPAMEPAVGPTVGPTAGPSPEIEDEDEDNKLMIIAGVSLCVCMIVVAIFMMKR